MKRKKVIILIYLFFTNLSLFAQDPHFTQYYASPILMNPALTGFFNGDYRVSACYRNQWPNVQYSYNTASFSADANVFKGMIGDGDIVGVGLTGMFDKSNNGGLKTNALSGSFSYHKLLDRFGINRLGVGLMVTSNSRVVDYSKFTFGQQLTPNGYNPNLPTGESKNGLSANYLSYAVGLLYSAITETSSFYCGSSMYHFNRPVEDFGGAKNEISPRFVVNAGGYFGVSDLNKVFLSGAFMKTDYSNDLIVGAAFSQSLSQEASDNFNFIAGGWYRYDDAIAPYVGLEYGNYRGAISYDINVSKLQPATNFRGGIEITLSYIFTKDPESNALKQTLCPHGSSQLRWFGY